MNIYELFGRVIIGSCAVFIAFIYVIYGFVITFLTFSEHKDKESKIFHILSGFISMAFVFYYCMKISIIVLN